MISVLSDDNTNELTSNGYLNSTKIINRFITKLQKLNDYNKAEMHKNHEAATLKLKSYTWNFDIVPCWSMDIGQYLIPDGKGDWKLTDPRIDNDRTTSINQKHKGIVLDVIRLIKYWNNRKVTLRIGSYLLECMVLDIYDSMVEKPDYYVDLEFQDLIGQLANAIIYDFQDPKGIQGNINNFSLEERVKISQSLTNTYDKAKEASKLEMTDKDQEAAINKWREVFGPDFPKYTD